MAVMGVHPRFAQMILRASRHGAARRACLLAAALGEASAEPALRGVTDVHRILDRFGDVPARPAADDECGADESSAPSRGWIRRAGRLARQWARPFPARDSARIDEGRMLGWAFPDRIARRRGAPGCFLMACGRGATIEPESLLAREEWIVAVELHDDGPDARIRLAAPIAQEDVEEDQKENLRREESVSWSRQEDAVAAVSRTSLGAIPLRQASLANPDPDAVAAALCDGIRAKGIENLNWTREARNVQARILFLAGVRPEDGWPDVSDDALALTLESWLSPFLEGCTRWTQVQKVDLREPLLALLGPLRRQLDVMAPTHLPVPSGSRIAVRYDRGETPVMSVRIQEVYGLAKSPSVADGRVQVVMELLSPAMRPLQVTRDLATFWKTTYALVRKEMRGRYPKHDWPEDPATAPPRRGLRRNG
ncbi:MAG: ATP-dependent helicase C-terminal domain-containing protein [Kiritimatiellia bacterium]